MSFEGMLEPLRSGHFDEAFRKISELLERDSTLVPWEELGEALGPSELGEVDLSGVESISPVTARELEELRELLTALRFTQAAPKLKRFSQRSPTNSQILVWTAELSAIAGEWYAAEDYLGRLPRTDKDAMRLRARVAFRQRRFALAEEYFSRLEENGALFPALALLRAIPQSDDPAAKLLEETLRTGIPPNRGAVRTDHWELAIEAAVAAYAPANVLARLLETAESIEATQARAASNGCLLPLESLKIAAEHCRESRDLHRAISFYRLLHRAEPGDPHTAERLLRLEYQVCETDPFRARRDLETIAETCVQLRRELLRTNPNHKEWRMAYGRDLRLADRFLEATAFVETLLEEDPSELRALHELVLISQTLRDVDATLKWTKRILETEPSDENALIAMARALRSEGEGAKAIQLMRQASESGSGRINLEYLRSLFFAGEFERAYNFGKQLATEPPAGVRLLMAAISIELGHVDEAEIYLEEVRASEEYPLFRYLIREQTAGSAAALPFLNQYFKHLGVQDICLNEQLGSQCFDQFTGTRREPSGAQGPLVSVVVTCGDGGDYIRTSVRSILEQSYSRLELLVVDDASTDGTAEVLEQLQREDSRIRIFTNSANAGTYVSKNRALQEAKGEYLAFQDSDDWSHPDRVKRCVEAMESSPHLPAMRTRWIRMTSQGHVAIRPRGNIAENCCISLFMRREVTKRIGYFDSVRADADIEYIHRLRLAFGQLPDLPWMLMFGRIREGALTSSGRFGMDRCGYNSIRRKYRDAYRDYHRSIVAGDSPYLEFPLVSRKFDAPAEMIG